MFKFKGFKATLNLDFFKKKGKSRTDGNFGASTTGVYRTSVGEFYENRRLSEPPKKLTPSMVKLPETTRHIESEVSTSKSSHDLRSSNSKSPPNLSKSTPEISFDPRGGPSHSRNNSEVNKIKLNAEAKSKDKEQKKLEKQRIAETKRQEKLTAQEQARAEKIRKENERQQRAREDKRQGREKQTQRLGKKKAAAPPPPSLPQDPQPARGNPLAQAPVRYSTNTLESSISRSSGPPPYSEHPRPSVVPNQKDGSGNTSFGKSIDSSWDMIAQHRQQINKPKVADNKSRNLVMDLHYDAGNASSISDVNRDSAA